MVIDDVYISPHVNSKINGTHDLDRTQVEEALANSWGHKMSPDRQGVMRMLCLGETASGQRVKMSLYPTAVPGQWNLGTAFPVSG